MKLTKVKLGDENVHVRVIYFHFVEQLKVSFNNKRLKYLLLFQKATAIII